MSESKMDTSEKQRKILLEGNVPSVVMRMAIPSVVMQIISLVYNTVDTYFIAQIDKSAAAAVGTVFAIQAVIQAVGFGFGMGVSSICSRLLGHSEDEEASKYATSGIFGAMMVALVISVVCMIFLNPILKLIGCTDTMLSHGRGYAIVILVAAPLSCASFVMGNIFKSEGHIVFSMYGTIVGAVVNLVLDPVLIFGLGWGTFGAGVATSMSQIVTLVMYASQLIGNKTVMKIRIKNISGKIKTYIDIITTGIPTVFRQGLAALATALLCKQASQYSDATVAAVTIANKCYMLVRNIVLGIGQGAQPVAGYNYGAGLYKRAKNSFMVAVKAGTVICVISAVVIYIFSSQIMWWFCKDVEVLEIGVLALRFACLVMPVMAFSTIVNQEYQCLGFKKQATVLASLRQGICFVPIILIMPALVGVMGVQMAQPLSDLATFIIATPFHIKMSKYLNQN